MELGLCPNCGEQIFELNNNRLGRPLGNYRSVKLKLKDGRSMIVPVCMDCHDKFELTDEFLKNLFLYLKDTAPQEWTEEKKIVYAKKYSNLEIVGFKKQGVLSVKDQKEGQICQ